ncbi:hypothetical protein ACQJBY_015678 [Aegilops geniculata]
MVQLTEVRSAWLLIYCLSFCKSFEKDIRGNIYICKNKYKCSPKYVCITPCWKSNEEPLNLGSDNKVANEVIDLEGENLDAIVDEPVGKKRKKTKSECWDHFDKTLKAVVINGQKIKEAWAKCKYCTYKTKRNSKNGTSVFLNHINMHREIARCCKWIGRNTMLKRSQGCVTGFYLIDYLPFVINRNFNRTLN